MKIDANSKLIMIGDSITDAGRVRPVGEGLFEALGHGYVSFVAGLLGAVCPEKRIRAVNMGTSGNTIRDIKARWQEDVVALDPDWVSLMIGINDVWRQFDSPLQSELHVSLDEYEATLDELIGSTMPRLEGFVLMTPYVIEPNRKDAMRETMDRYGEAVRRAAQKHGAVIVDTQAAFDEVLQNVHPMSLAWDRVHPNVTGHMIITRAFLNAIEFPW